MDLSTKTERLAMTSTNTPRSESKTALPVSHGRFVWYDLLTTDVAAATSFYTNIAGWGTHELDMGLGRKYHVWTADDVPLGGVVRLKPETGLPGTPPHWVGAVAVADVDATVRQAVVLGGKILTHPMSIPEVGRYAVIGDPQGAVIALVTPVQPAEPALFAPKLSEFSWHELVTTNHETAFSFYSTLFGWKQMGEHDMGSAVGAYLMFGQPMSASDTAAYGGMYTAPPAVPMPPSWLYYIRVESADDAAGMVKSLGGQVLAGPMDVPSGDRIAQCLDPQGGIFALHSVTQR
jgi:predicted enzyme related to lactoylglutathione lyase